MVKEIGFRNSICKGNFRFEVTPSLWRSLYEICGEGGATNVVTVKRNGTLRGYAVYSTFVRSQFRALRILDICADSRDTITELIKCIIERGRAEGADFVYVRKAASPEDNIFDQKGFISFVDSIIMVVLLNPYELLRAFSQDVMIGTNLKLNIRGFESVIVKVGKKGIKVVTEEKHKMTVSTDTETFLKLSFGRTTFLKQFLKGKIKVSNLFKLPTAHRLFKEIRQEKWHIPSGDWV